MRYQQAVARARFLEKRERQKWSALGSFLSTKELKSAEKAILNEDLRQLDMKQQLEKIKPNSITRAG